MRLCNGVVKVLHVNTTGQEEVQWPLVSPLVRLCVGS
jgi:hypothetical protein